MTKIFLKTILPTFILVLLLTSTAGARMVSVASDIVNMRSGPGKNYPVLWELGKGYPLKIIETRGNWIKVSDYENDKGWIYKKLVNRTAHLVVKNNIVNIRSGPGKDHKVIRQAKKGVVFKTMGKEKNWVRVFHDESKLTGWIKRNLLWGW